MARPVYEIIEPELSALEQVVKAFFEEQATRRSGFKLYKLTVHCTRTTAITAHLQSQTEDWRELPQFDYNGNLICQSNLPDRSDSAYHSDQLRCAAFTHEVDDQTTKILVSFHQTLQSYLVAILNMCSALDIKPPDIDEASNDDWCNALAVAHEFDEIV